MVSQKNRKKQLIPFIGKLSFALFSILLVLSIFKAYQLYGYVFKENVSDDAIVLIPTGSTFNDVVTIIDNQNFIVNMKAFMWVAKKKKYPENVKAGRYEFKKGMNTNEVVTILRYGKQAPVRLTFNNVRRFEDLAGKVDKYLEPDSVSLLQVLRNKNNFEKYSFDEATFQSMFIPNTYEFYWNTTAELFIERMHAEYNRFWNNDRKAKAEQLGMTTVEIAVLASIVQEETNKNDEKPIVAGLYLNRLKRGMLLQADPTVKFAVNNFTARRVTNEMLIVDSPYNTYKYAGLPPGPINFPEITSIDAVLNASSHNYLFMCAREDFSGYHNFASNLAQHNINATKYRNELNRRKIWK